ncbi:UDP-glucose 4-epimerase GalE [Desulfurivibrio alkaliphilus]|uniref:UDP-glucose 4-epimerase n=1 Tax=Desulfurivibrio alkaliphilus (strain DSM 19089 / UNIQEM U267 / AHT2) TaxID=589865 RepID=D6Z4L0_DESAT|nr:UDP-glucose 4-epimerase GalE [Desulfurivibrio alkaliphilus]ADH86485.1 UDP-glucose 4-epimerase [Desulfurivibrio alkaliphilus AHT 2]
MKTYLLTGGAGYIGSHTALALLEAGHRVVVFDNLVNSSAEALRRVERLTGQAVTLFEGDMRDPAALRTVFAQHQPDAVIHFAGLKAVGESVRLPLDYYENNVTGTLNLCRAMVAAGVFTLVFSSSATVYGTANDSPLKEEMNTGVGLTNPYGRSKWMIEQLLQDAAAADERWRIALLRYFNPVGAHESGLIGEDPRGEPNNLMPYIAQVAVGRRRRLGVFGNDYPTPDGTGVRDYIHVVDLALGHVQALQALDSFSGCQVWNLGTGKGYSVLEMVQAFAKACGAAVPYEILPRRPGDLAVCFADPAKAQAELNWRAERSLNDMVTDAWRWQSQNPEGYDTALGSRSFDNKEKK